MNNFEQETTSPPQKKKTSKQSPMKFDLRSYIYEPVS